TANSCTAGPSPQARQVSTIVAVKVRRSCHRGPARATLRALRPAAPWGRTRRPRRWKLEAERANAARGGISLAAGPLSADQQPGVGIFLRYELLSTSDLIVAAIEIAGGVDCHRVHFAESVPPFGRPEPGIQPVARPI